LAFDRRVAATATASVFVAEPEAALFRCLVPEAAAKTMAIANGIDAAYFSPDRTYPVPFSPADGPAMVFTGTMDYWPNVDAAIWFANEILPLIRQRHPTACFYVVGANPAAEVTALKALDGVVVTGRVDDVRPYIAHADVAVAPVRIARGIQNKVLEAMAMARPVVTTPKALEGIDAVPGRELLLGGDAQSFADAVLSVLDGSAMSSLGAAARTMVLRAHDWEALLSAFDPLLGIAAPSADIAHDQRAEQIGQPHG
jgi:sugar transferase (PEP-CTERM/EpsH1 system associated)